MLHISSCGVAWSFVCGGLSHQNPAVATGLNVPLSAVYSKRHFSSLKKHQQKCPTNKKNQVTWSNRCRRRRDTVICVPAGVQIHPGAISPILFFKTCARSAVYIQVEVFVQFCEGNSRVRCAPLRRFVLQTNICNRSCYRVGTNWTVLS